METIIGAKINKKNINIIHENADLYDYESYLTGYSPWKFKV